ncbi:uncharacterized protein V2V93DRAFT_383372 [Kockiozyma suomiensis]|uniref:uncharacterized protein n=1 Tax=Kockiozyma suomiensis TaxID=1337062 RepID=UPI0033439BCD
MSTVQDQNQQLPYSAFPKQSPSISNDISNDSNSNTGIIDISSNIAIDLDDDLPLAQVAAIAQQDQQSSMLMHPELNISQSNAMSTDELREGLKRLDELYEELLQLRVAAPRLLRALSKSDRGTTPRDIYHSFATHARQLTETIDKFTSDLRMAAPLFDYATQSRNHNPNGMTRGTYGDEFDEEAAVSSFASDEEVADGGDEGYGEHTKPENSMVDLENEVKMEDLSAEGLGFAEGSMMDMINAGTDDGIPADDNLDDDDLGLFS